MKKHAFLSRLVLVSLLAGGSACGVKGPPLPPVADTPQASDRTNETNASRPTPSPTPSKTPAAKKKGKSAGR